MRRTKSRTSSSLKALASDSIGTAWRISANFEDGRPPTRRVGESGVASSGCAASSASSSRTSASYSASVMAGASSSW